MNFTRTFVAIIMLLLIGSGFKAEAQVPPRCEALFLRQDASVFEDLILDLKSFDNFSRLYSQYNEAAKKITIEEHSRQVFQQFLIEDLQVQINPELRDILPMVIALHDIGKPLAIEAGHRDDQHLYTLPLVKRYLEQHKWKKRDIERALALISYTGMGDFIKGQKHPLQVALDIQHLAFTLSLSAWDFYQAKKVFYLSDAGSYTQLRTTVFHERSDGTLIPKARSWHEIEFWLMLK